MKQGIISDGEARQILKNQLRKIAVEKRRSDLLTATAERRAEILQEVERELEKQLRQRTKRRAGGILLH